MPHTSPNTRPAEQRQADVGGDGERHVVAVLERQHAVRFRSGMLAKSVRPLGYSRSIQPMCENQKPRRAE